MKRMESLESDRPVRANRNPISFSCAGMLGSITPGESYMKVGGLSQTRNPFTAVNGKKMKQSHFNVVLTARNSGMGSNLCYHSLIYLWNVIISTPNS
jgi:hypothetical protein